MDAAIPRLRLFGPPTAEDGARAVALPFERRHQLCVLLALRRGWVPRAEVAAMLWPELDSKLAYANLRKSLFRLQTVAWAGGVESQGASLRFEPATDVVDFEQALRDGRAAEAVEIGAAGELLAGFDDGQSEAWTRWLGFERDRLRTAWRGAALTLLAGALEPVRAISLSARLLELDPLDEGALREHMRWLALEGQAGAARSAYRAFAARLAEDLGIEPNVELQAAHDRLATAPNAVAPPPKADTDSRFIGRGVELRRIAELLTRDECRLLSLIGPGGVGKTRLAQRLSVEGAGVFPDGATFVALEEVETAELLGSRIAQAAGAVRSGQDPWRSAAEAIGTRRRLLVLDNVEQLVPQAAPLERLLAACPRLKLVVTSRVRLALASEWPMPIEGLPCPEPEDADCAEAFDAVRLFIAVAARLSPGFDPTSERAAIIDICRHVEGLPLAIELAAAWVRVLPCSDIAEELRHGAELLQATEASHPPRHASFDQVFEQSWQRLAQAEREVLARLSLFQGGFTVTAARVVTRASLPVLGALSDKSLLRRDGERMRLHPLVQQAAAARLGPDERAAAADAHMAFFFAMGVRLGQSVEDGDRAALDSLDADFDNIVRAWMHGYAQADLATLRRVSRTLLYHCSARGRTPDGLRLMRHALASPQVAGDDALRGLLLASAAQLEYRLDRHADAAADATRALELATRSGDAPVRMMALTTLASSALMQSQLDLARQHFQESLELAVQEDEPHHRAAALDHLALVEKRLGRFGESLSLSRQSLLQHRRIGDGAGIALCLNNLGSLLVALHDHEAARQHLDEALALSQREGLHTTSALVRANLADLSLQVGALDESALHAARGLDAAQAMGQRIVAAYLQLHQARLALRQGAADQAADLLGAGAVLVMALTMPALRLRAALVFGEVAEALGEARCARRVFEFAAGHPSATVLDADELRAAWQRLAPPSPDDPAWPGIELDDLVRRIALEAPKRHAALIHELR